MADVQPYYDAQRNAFLRVPEDSTTVANTKFLPWRPAGQGQVEIPVHMAIHTLLPHCTLCEEDVMAGAFAEVSPLTFNLQADAWRRIVQALIEAKLFDETFINAQDFFNKCNNITMPAEELIIKEADIEPGQPFDGEGADATLRRHRGQQSPAEQARPAPGPTDLRFLSLISIADLTAPSSPALLPLTTLVGMLGPCLSRKERAREMSCVRITAAILRQGLNSFLGTGGGGSFEEPVLAVSAKPFLQAIDLPPAMQTFDVGDTEQRSKLLEGIQ